MGLLRKRSRLGGREGRVEGERERETDRREVGGSEGGNVVCILRGSEDGVKVREVG